MMESLPRPRARASARALLAGVLIGAFGVPALWFGGYWMGRHSVPAAEVETEAVAYRPPPPPGIEHIAAEPQAPAFPPATAACAFAPLLAHGGPEDGQFTLTAMPAGAGSPGTRAYVDVAREAAGLGRVRDAEVALIAACRAAGRAAPPPSAPVADVQMLLARLYAEVPAARSSGAVLERQRELLAQGEAAYAASLGRTASKTRLARTQLAALPAEPVLAADTDADTDTVVVTSVLGAGPMVAVAPPVAVAPARQQRVAAPALVRSDPELAQLESDLRRLRTQAESVAADPQGLQRRSRQARASRDAQCADKDCLVRWYAQRRKDLLAEF